MASTINADNGVVSGSSGLKSTADTSGVLALQSNGSTGLTLNTDLSVTFAGAQTLSAGTANGVTYLNGSKVLTSGSALTFDGTNLTVGTGASTYKLNVYGASSPYLGVSDGTINTFFGAATGGSIAALGTTSNHPVSFYSNSAEQMRLTSTGLGIGTSSISYPLVIGVAGTGTGVLRAGASFINVDAGYQATNVSGTASAPSLIWSGDDNTGIWHPASDTLAFSTAGSERFRIGSAGQLGVGTSPSYGTSGQVLTSGGSGAAPTWATPSGGSWVYLSTVTASGAATADIETTFNSTYDMYVIVAENVLMATDGVTLQAGMKIGGTYLTTATYNWWASRPTSTSPISSNSGSTGDTRIYLQGNMANTAATTSAFTAYIAAPSSTSAIKTMYVSGIASVSGGPSALINAIGSNSGTAALTGIRFYGSAGNISGTFRLYGIKNS